MAICLGRHQIGPQSVGQAQAGDNQVRAGLRQMRPGLHQAARDRQLKPPAVGCEGAPSHLGVGLFVFNQKDLDRVFVHGNSLAVVAP